MRSLYACLLAGFVALACPAPSARAQTLPGVPCGETEAQPAPNALGAPPAVSVWTARDLANWAPPACAGWSGTDARSLIAISGRLRIPGGPDGVLQRFGAISSTTGVRFWAKANQDWETLIHWAHALAADKPRADFSPAEMKSGQPLAFRQYDNDSGEISFAMRARETSSGEVVITTQNTSTIRKLLIPLFSPGELQTVYVLHPDGGDTWRFYALTRVRATANGLTDGHEAAIVNRGVAIFRHLAGIQTDKEPPAMR